ncbi:hypothetical protein DEU56DRAFT_761073 [Suillus clintonianus]|uniref:uncharacterized protein n=1 Tax=Suillus clintonianus TaxID=1904413 RepID=UPI001B88357E|nr:uncharacterized protein DEU56DRAFT_761073 [Suillus clintonianus]KAG2119304.1 hypothetical protein DEU56DRAFT_761073 [Suillus clintonianus]
MSFRISGYLVSDTNFLLGVNSYVPIALCCEGGNEWHVAASWADDVASSKRPNLCARRMPDWKIITGVEGGTSSDISQEEFDALWMEANTWGLLKDVMPQSEADDYYTVMKELDVMNGGRDQSMISS